MLIEYLGKRPRVSPQAFLAPNATLIGDVEVARDVSIWFGAVLRADLGKIAIGAGSSVQDNAVIHADRSQDVTIGKDVTVGHGAVLHSCTVKDGAVIGVRAVVLDGAIVGEQAMVAAGSVVTPGTEVPPRTLSAGIPARVKKEVSGQSLWWVRQGAIDYYNLSRSYLDQGIGRVEPGDEA